MFVYFQLGLGGCQYWYDSAAFLFSLVNNPGWEPLKLDQTGWNASSRCCSIYSCSSHGPTFGHGLSIYIANAASHAYRSYTDLGFTYSPPPGNSYGSSFTRSFLADSYHFHPDEVEVFYEATKWILKLVVLVSQTLFSKIKFFASLFSLFLNSIQIVSNL